MVKLFYPKICKGNNFFIANLNGFAIICKLPVAQNFKVMQSKISKKVVFHNYFKFCFYKVAKKLLFNVQIVQVLKSAENLKTLKNDGHFRIPHPPLVYNRK